MRAIRIHYYGGPDAMQLESMPMPVQSGQGQGIDTWSRQPALTFSICQKLPRRT